jgi:hypothetical protein
MHTVDSGTIWAIGGVMRMIFLQIPAAGIRLVYSVSEYRA